MRGLDRSKASVTVNRHPSLAVELPGQLHAAPFLQGEALQAAGRFIPECSLFGMAGVKSAALPDGFPGGGVKQAVKVFHRVKCFGVESGEESGDQGAKNAAEDAAPATVAAGAERAKGGGGDEWCGLHGVEWCGVA